MYDRYPSLGVTGPGGNSGGGSNFGLNAYSVLAVAVGVGSGYYGWRLARKSGTVVKLATAATFFNVASGLTAYALNAGVPTMLPE